MTIKKKLFSLYIPSVNFEFLPLKLHETFRSLDEIAGLQPERNRKFDYYVQFNVRRQ